MAPNSALLGHTADSAFQDQRNHGKRTRFRNTNLSFDVNENHLIDMMATIYGGVQDQQLVMDFLPAYLFPHNERRIDEFMAAGVSMGGHTVWRLLREGEQQ